MAKKRVKKAPNTTNSSASQHTESMPAPDLDKVQTDNDEIAGYIFMCNTATKPECFMYRVFGLPASRLRVLEKIKPNDKLFLFDTDVKLLYGLYVADTSGQLALEPYAFGGRFPAQVKFSIFRDCLPLPEAAFKEAIKDNYYSVSKFKQELNVEQANKLVSLFRPIDVPSVQPSSLAFQDGVRSLFQKYMEPNQQHTRHTHMHHGISVPSPQVPPAVGPSSSMLHSRASRLVAMASEALNSNIWPSSSDLGISHAHVPSNVPDAISHAHVPSNGPDSVGHAHVPLNGPDSVGHTLVPSNGPDNVGHGQVPSNGSYNISHAHVPSNGSYNISHAHVPSNGPYNISHAHVPSNGPYNISHAHMPSNGPYNTSHAHVPYSGSGTRTVGHGYQDQAYYSSHHTTLTTDQRVSIRPIQAYEMHPNLLSRSYQIPNQDDSALPQTQWSVNSGMVPDNSYMYYTGTNAATPSYSYGYGYQGDQALSQAQPVSSTVGLDNSYLHYSGVNPTTYDYGNQGYYSFHQPVQQVANVSTLGTAVQQTYWGNAPPG